MDRQTLFYRTLLAEAGGRIKSYAVIILEEKQCFENWILVVSVVNRCIQCTKIQRWVHSCYSDFPRQVYYLVYIIRSGSLLSWNVFACGTCLGDNCSVELKLEFKKGEDVLEEMQKFCYLGDLISCYGGKSKAVSTRIGSAWKEFRELSVVVVGKQGLSLKKWGMIYQ